MAVFLAGLLVTCAVTCGNMYGNVLFINMSNSLGLNHASHSCHTVYPIKVNFANFSRALSGRCFLTF